MKRVPTTDYADSHRLFQYDETFFTAKKAKGVKAVDDGGFLPQMTRISRMGTSK